ncbi:tRNA (adenosine(37)-N6)-threonylcarbamoyltransferase complex transferase subunit TsaD [Sanyastnella coralliicola]|uniref:tRNA (adenosine(37)-N6)-threonylcarbamoyltransferase complex transferase subunit TsaD n=1 Tax=Sanyastnella coralliicola TaxID=3069118 RepID=UPI0027BAD0F0|nr:tRNA (adenosine(37)-N6)-threonylcarbamoyltransferase complex transferase subunit TsaD [Longitalea sp. SCSIO 12813]
MQPLILAIESSCDDTSAAVLRGNEVLSNVVANQEVHELYGGVVPELASREHQKHILPVVNAALVKAGVDKKELDAIAYTRGPGLLGSLLVGASFAKSLALALDIPLLEVHHMHAHILAHFIHDGNAALPELPMLCLTVSGGHTQLVVVHETTQMEVIGETIDDAAGEAFDKIAKIMGLPYPGGPLIDKYAKDGDPLRFQFSHPKTDGLNFSFSGLKTAVLYFLRDAVKKEPDFVKENLADICASVQYTIVSILLNRLKQAAEQQQITTLALAGGVSANSELRRRFEELGDENDWKTFIPDFSYCTDNAAMIGIAGLQLFLAEKYGALGNAPSARWTF